MSAFSPKPRVELLNSFERPYENSVAAARTCYSAHGLIRAADVSGDELHDPLERSARERQRDAIAASVYRAGHHTTLQHAHFQFGLSGVSRLFIWSFLHAHPFYNSEQVSQRYVKVRAGDFVVPTLPAQAVELYVQTCKRLQSAYRRLTRILQPVAEARFFERFPARAKRPDRWQSAIRKKAQEVARYVLPLATQAYLHHTISALTLLRYRQMAAVGETPEEQALVVGQMIDEVVRFDPHMARLLDSPLDPALTPEGQWVEKSVGEASPRAFLEEFDRGLEGRCSRLVATGSNNEALLAGAVRETLGAGSVELSDDEAIALVLDPARSPYNALPLNLKPHSSVMRALRHVSYTFRKKLSHTADSQNQRHRLVPGSRPLLALHLDEQPDYVTPALIMEDEAAAEQYRRTMVRLWEDVGRLRVLGVDRRTSLYLMPNALAVRFTETGDLLGLHHKLVSRLCYNAQEEIFAASLDEVRQIAAVDPRIGRYLLAPCGLRKRGGETPPCPEGDRFCGVRVWDLDLESYARLI